MTDPHDAPRTTAAMCHAIDDAGVGREVAVAQEDREFAAQWIVIAPQNQRVIRAGEWDHHHGVQAAARHRLAATSLHDMQGTAALASPCRSGEGVGERDDVRRSIIRQLGDDPHADRVILAGTDWDIVLEALREASNA